MKISELSNRTNLSKDTIRYYEKLNLLEVKTEGNHKNYTKEHVERLNHIQLLKHASFSLKEIQYFISLDQKFQKPEDIQQMNDEDYNTLVKIIEEKRSQITQQIKALNQADTALQYMENKLMNLERLS